MSQRTSLAQRQLLAGWLALGTVVVWLLLAMVALWFVEKITFSSRVEEFLHCRSDGTPVIVKMHFDGPTFDWRTLDGRPLTVPNDEPTLPVAYLEGPAGQKRYGEGGWSQRVLSFVDLGRLAPNWYFLHDGKPAGAGYFVGYDRLDKRLVGYIGREGFRSDPPPTGEQFAVDRRLLPDLKRYSDAVGGGQHAPNWLRPHTAGYSADVIHLLSAGHLYEVDLTRRTVRDAWPDGDLVSLGVAQVGAAIGGAGRPTSEMKRSWLVLRTRERVVVHGAEPGDERSFVLPAELRGAYLIMYLTADGTVIADFGREASSNGSIVQLCRFDSTGKVVDRATAELENHAADLVHQRAFPYIISALSPGILPGGTIAVLTALNQAPIDGPESGLVPTLRRTLDNAWPQLLLQIVLSAVLAWVCRRRQHRYAQNGTWAWMVFVFIFGVPGWLGYLWHRRWPLLATCPTCARAVPRDREACAACRAEFPLPSRTGAELFA